MHRSDIAMLPRHWLMLASLGTAAASSDSFVVTPHGPRASIPPGTAHLYAGGGRGAASTANPYADKLDAALAEIARHSGLAAADHPLAQLHALNPAAHFKQPSTSESPRVLIDAVTRGDPQALRDRLVAFGLSEAAVFSNDVGGWLPVAQIQNAAAAAEVHSLRAAMPRARAGAVTSQGDFAARGSVIRSTYPSLTGAGITVGVLSDSFDCYAVYAAPGSGVPVSGGEGYAYNGFTADAATDISTGDLPSGVNVLEEAECLDYGAPADPPFGDEGRAMLQIVHDVAPGASLAFYTAENSEADFSNGIVKLAAAGAKVIADDVGYFDEPFYQDGLEAQAIATVAAEGVAYFSAAGNDGQLSYENTAPSFGTLSGTAPNAGEYLLNFDASGQTTTTSLPVTIASLPPGDFVAIVVEWDQPYVTGAPGSPGASSQINLCVTGASGADVITDYDGHSTTCTGLNALGSDPVQILIIDNPANAAGNTASENLNIQIGLAGGTTVPGRIKVAVEDDGAGSTINAFNTHSATLQGHPGAAGAAAVGAAFYFQTPACGTTPAVLETYSSEGGDPILFDTTGARLSTPVYRQKPDFVGPDGVNDTFLGYTLASAGTTGPNGKLNTTISECQNDPSYPNFFGTSAATPHAAAIAALMMQANSATTASQIYAALRSSALSMNGTSTPDYNTGYGFIKADAALALLPPGAPSLSVGATSLTSGSSTTLTWSSINTTSCTASGSWSGTLAASGTQTITPATGTESYGLSCANAAGTSPSATVSVTVSATGSGSSGSTGGSGSTSTGSTSTGSSSTGSSTTSTSSGSHGGGSLDLLSILALGALSGFRFLRRPAGS
jgi:hypothetical protein